MLFSLLLLVTGSSYNLNQWGNKNNHQILNIKINDIFTEVFLVYCGFQAHALNRHFAIEVVCVFTMIHIYMGVGYSSCHAYLHIDS